MYGPTQRVWEWSSLKPVLHSHIVPRYERTQRPFAQLHSSESSSELSPAGEKEGREEEVKTSERILELFSIKETPNHDKGLQAQRAHSQDLQMEPSLSKTRGLVGLPGL